MSSSTDSDRAIRSAVDRIALVPSKYRLYNQTPSAAWIAHGISGELLAQLLDAGFPHQVSEGTVYLDELDLANASFRLSLRSARAMALRSWVIALRSVTALAGRQYRVSFRPQCPEASHPGQCEITQPREIAAILGLGSTTVPPSGVSVAFSPTSVSILLPENVRAVTDELADVEYHLLPSQLHEDCGFLAEARLADCPLAAEYLYRAAVRRGLRARRCFGIFVSVPFSIPHFWVELLVDGTWHAIDPHMIRMLTMQGLVDSAAWPVYRTLGGAAWRLADRDVPLALHNGHEIPCSLPTVSSLTRTSGSRAGPLRLAAQDDALFQVSSPRFPRYVAERSDRAMPCPFAGLLA
jgi:hypothetical protein